MSNDINMNIPSLFPTPGGPHSMAAGIIFIGYPAFIVGTYTLVISSTKSSTETDGMFILIRP